MTTLPDTNAIIRYLIGDIPAQYKTAEAFFEKVRKGSEKAFILESVLVECVYVLTKYYGVPRPEVSEKLSSLLHYKGIVNHDDNELLKALALYAVKSIDIVDCILYAKFRGQNHRLFSFDEKLIKMKR